MLLYDCFKKKRFQISEWQQMNEKCIRTVFPLFHESTQIEIYENK